MTTIPTSLDAIAPEIEILLLCARVGDIRETDARLRLLLRQGLNWERLIAASGPHGMRAILYAKLLALNAPEVPPEWMAWLHRQGSQRLQKTLASVGELFKLLDAFAREGIQAVPFKGPLLAVAAYGNLSARPFCDLDLLVHKQDARRACEILSAQGYLPRYRLSRSQQDGLFRFACEHPFHRPDGTSIGGKKLAISSVDLHWNLFPRSFSISLDSEKFWDRLDAVTIFGRTIPTFAVEDLLLYLCVHGFAHHWDRIEWISAVGGLIARRPNLDWERLLSAAQDIGGGRILALGLLLAHDWIGAPVPEASLQGVRSKSTIKRLIGHVRCQLQRKPETLDSRTTLGESFFFDLEAQGDPLKRITHFFRRTLIPSIDDVEWVALPRSLFPLYYLLRPLRLFSRRR